MKANPIILAVTHPSGGIRELWVNLARGLAARGETTDLLAFYPGPIGDGDGIGDGWTLLADAKPVTPFGWIAMLVALARWLRRRRPATIITAMPAMNVLLPLFARLFSPGTRVIVTHHSPTSTHSSLLDRLDGITGTLSNVRAVIGVSRAVTGSLSGKLAAYGAKTRTINNALPPEIEALIDTVAPQLPRSAPRGRRIVATGRLAYQKNYPMLLRAVARLPDCVVDIVGDGPEEAELRALIVELDIGGRVFLHGKLAREETLRLAAGCDVFVQVSRFEGHSLALIEAARLGLPLIVSDVPEQVEAITAQNGDLCGVVVLLGDDVALAAAILATLDPEGDYRALSVGARRIAEEARFDAMVDAYLAVVR